MANWIRLLQEIGNDGFFLRSLISSNLTLVLADVDAIKIITRNPDLFAKPIETYKALGGFGSNLVVSDAEEWKRHRLIAGSSFGHEASKVAWEESIKVCDQWVESLKPGTPGPLIIETKSALAQLTFMVICPAGFGYAAPWPGSEEDQIPLDHSTSFYSPLGQVFPSLLVMSLLPQWVMKLLFRRIRKMNTALAEFRLYVAEMVEERREEIGAGIVRHDLFTVLITASHE